MVVVLYKILFLRAFKTQLYDFQHVRWIGRYSASREKVRKVNYLIAQVILRCFLCIWGRLGPIWHALSAYHSGLVWGTLL